MAHAPHTNDNVTQPLILGCFVERDHGHMFEYAERPADDRGGWAPEYPHLVYVGSDRGPEYANRPARVLKTVAYVVVDEGPSGEPTVQKWDIKQHRLYDVRWARDLREARS